MRSAMRRVAPAALAVALGVLLTGCAPHALGLHDTGITESLPMAEYHDVWAGVPLDNASDVPITMRSLELTDRENLRAGTPFVIEVAPGQLIDWYAPPGTAGMQQEVAKRVPFAGFEVPAHTKDRYEAVVLLTPQDTRVDASITGMTVGYTSGDHEWTETWIEHGSLRGPG